MTSTSCSQPAESGPYVLTAHSYGGLIALLYTRTYPKDVVGLVLVDILSEVMQQVASPEALARWDQLNRVSVPKAPEGVELLDGFAKIDNAPPLPHLPAIVLSADKPWDPALIEVMTKSARGALVTGDDWLRAQDLLAASLQAKHVKNTNSGHFIYMYSPHLVADAIREVVEVARNRSR